MPSENPQPPFAPRTSSPALRALVAYLRPLKRPSLLAGLAELGLFVTEVSAGELETLLGAPQMHPDLAVVAGDVRPSHLEAIRRIRSSLTPAILSVLPPGVQGREVREAGAMEAISESRMGDLAMALRPVAQRARQLRNARPEATRREPGHLRPLP